jgi:predicted nucleotidyltransferase
MQNQKLYILPINRYDYTEKEVNMLTPKQIKIFEVFLRKPYKQFTFKEIKEFSKENSNSTIQTSIKRFLEENLIKKTNLANIILYQVNLENDSVFSYFNILFKEDSKLQQPLTLILRELSGIFASIVIFGSYVTNSQTKNSDLDVAIFVNNKEDKKNCQLIMNTINLKSMIHIDYHIFTKEEMLQMLKDKYENLGKQIAYKHIVIQNHKIFYDIINEGISNGFKIIYS